MSKFKFYGIKRYGSWQPKIGFTVIKVNTKITLIFNPFNRRYSFEN